MKLRGKMLSVSPKWFYTVVLACTIGILLGSFFDFQINERLTNVTKLGSFFAAYGCYFSYCLYPAAGMCLYKGLKKNLTRFFALFASANLCMCLRAGRQKEFCAA